MMGNPYASLNAPTIYTWSAIFDSLTYVRNDGTVIPWLATSWSQSGPYSWVFKLREGVYFSNGEEFTADAVVHAVEYLTSAESNTDVVAQMLDSMVSAKALDSHTVEIFHSRSNILFPREAASLRIVAPKHWKELGKQGFAKEPHGTGPFVVTHWKPGKVVLEAFEKSWRRPYFKQMEIIAVPEGPQRVQGIISGGLHLILGSVPSQMRELTQLGHNWLSVPGSGSIVFSLIINPDHPAFSADNKPLTDIRVRKALNLAIDRESYLSILLDGRTVAPSQPAPKGSFGYNPNLKPYPYDPEEARNLLKDAGYPNGFDLVFEVVPGASIPNGSAIYQKVAEDLSKIGVKLQLKSFSLPQFFNAIHSGEFKGQGFMNDFPTAPQMDALRGMRLHSCLWKTPWLCNSNDQALITLAMSEPNLQTRQKLTEELMAIYHEQAYMLYLFESVDFYGMHGELTGFESDGLFIQYEKIRLK